MRTLIIAVVLATSLLVTKPQPPTQLTAEYDKKKQMTTLYSGQVVLWKQPYMQQLSLVASFEFPKQTITKPQMVLLSFQTLVKEKLLFPTMTLSVLVDDQRFDFGKMSGEWKGPSGGLWIERLKTPISYEQFSQIVSAKKVVMIVAEREYNLSDDHLRSLRALAQVMQREGQQVK